MLPDSWDSRITTSTDKALSFSVRHVPQRKNQTISVVISIIFQIYTYVYIYTYDIRHVHFSLMDLL